MTTLDNRAGCRSVYWHLCWVANFIVMLTVIKLNVVILSVMTSLPEPGICQIIFKIGGKALL
jgi:hypothetical protein